MDNSILSTEIQDFINNHLNDKVTELALKKNPFPNIDWKVVLNQIEAKQKAKEKLPTWFNTPNIIYPAKISIEQTSSEKTALYKAQLISGETLIDLTGGFGVDDYYFSKRVNNVLHYEINTELSKIVAHNYKELNIKNIICSSGDSTEILKKTNIKADWIYIDPSRRSDSKGKVFLLKDCLPNVPLLLDFYFYFTPNILIKTAPILDIHAGLSELKNVTEIHIVAIENEVKELLWLLKKDFNSLVKVNTVNLLENKKQEFCFYIDKTSKNTTFNLPEKYLYEPNAAIMKSGGFEEVAIQFNLNKIHQHSHLYTSDNLIIDFPGRIFEITHNFEYSKTTMKSYLEKSKANITTRNFPETVENIRKKWKIKDGGDIYCFFTTDMHNNKIVLLCKKVL